MQTRVKWYENYQKKQRKRKSKIFRTFTILIYIFLFVLGGISVNETYAIYNTLAKSSAVEAGTIAEILEVEGEFDAEGWLESGESGIRVTNMSSSKVWVYFNIAGELIQAVQHIEPVRLEPNESYEIPIIPANTPPLKFNGKVNELGLLGWKNNNQEFTGSIIAGVLNGYASYDIGTISVKGKDIFERFVEEKEYLENDKREIISANSVRDIGNVNDILLLLANKIALMKERDELVKQRDALIEENKELFKENSRLRKRVNSLEGEVDSLYQSLDGAKRRIDELLQPPAETTPVLPPAEPGEQVQNPDKEDQGEGDTSKEEQNSEQRDTNQESEEQKPQTEQKSDDNTDSESMERESITPITEQDEDKDKTNDSSQ